MVGGFELGSKTTVTVTLSKMDCMLLFSDYTLTFATVQSLLERQIQKMANKHATAISELEERHSAQLSEADNLNTQRLQELEDRHASTEDKIRKELGAEIEKIRSELKSAETRASEERTLEKAEKAAEAEERKIEAEKQASEAKAEFSNITLNAQKLQETVESITTSMAEMREDSGNDRVDIDQLKEHMAESKADSVAALEIATTTREAQVKGMKELKAGWEKTEEEVEMELKGYDRRLEMLREELIKLLNGKMTAAQLRQAINASELRRMERDLEAGRLYADANAENLQAANIAALGANLENTLKLVHENTNTIGALQNKFSVSMDETDKQGFAVDQTLDRVTCRFEGVQTMLDRLRKVLAQVGWTAAAAALGEEDAPDPHLEGLEGAIGRVEERLKASEASLRTDLTSVCESTDIIADRLEKMEDNTLIKALDDEVQSIQQELKTKVWSEIEANQRQLEGQALKLEVQEGSGVLIQQKMGDLETEVQRLGDNTAILKEIELVKEAVDNCGTKTDVVELQMNVEDLQTAGKDAMQQWEMQFEDVTKAWQNKIDDVSAEELQAIEAVHHRVDVLETRLSSVKALANVTAQSGGANKSDMPSVHGRTIQSASRMRDDVTPGRIRAQSAKKSKGAARFFSKPGLYTDKTGEEYHSPVRKQSVVQLPSNNQSKQVKSKETSENMAPFDDMSLQDMAHLDEQAGLE